MGPGEFVAGLPGGVVSLIGSTVGGAADAVGKITGALGTGVAALSLDEEFQKKRQQERNKLPQNVTEGIARSGNYLVTGFVDGVTGVVTKPLEGAREDGVGGFVKGMGKGLIGAVTRPATGVVDFVSGTFTTVKVATEGEKFALPDGQQLLKEVENGKYASTDAYIAHLSMCRDGRSSIILTSKRILFAEKDKIPGRWSCEWEYSWDEIEPPVVCPEGIKVLLKEPESTFPFREGRRGEKGQIIKIADRQMAESICKLMRGAMDKKA